jgi:hypothetical protein
MKTVMPLRSTPTWVNHRMFHVEHFNRSNQESLHCARQPALCSTWNIAGKVYPSKIPNEPPHRMFHVEHYRARRRIHIDVPITPDDRVACFAQRPGYVQLS